ncbi:hypothetical protein G9A89_004223 [Geosiphon pyriformis]|nr:hypothetical protein G9A89_004223 [Geosiphon pyriformis]
MNKFDGVQIFTSGLDSGYLSSGVAIVMDISLARHVCKVSKVPGQLLSIKLFFKNKLSVFILGLYAGASSIAVNKSFFVVLGGDFNENSLYKSVSFKRCLNLGLVNSLGVKKTIDFILVSSNLVNTVVNHNVVDANRDYWKFDFRGANDSKWSSFRDAISANARMFANEFTVTVQLLDLDIMWSILHKIMTLLANEIFKKKWFKNFDEVFTRDFSRFYRLELLVFKLVKTFCLVSSVEFVSFTLVVKFLFLSDSNFDMIHSALAKVRKSYHSSKLLKSKHAEEACIKAAIIKRIESFESDKSHTIRSVLECFFRKVVLDHLVVSNELVLEPSLVKSKVDRIIEGWTRKCRSCQYQSLKYVFDGAFFGIMCSVGIDKLLGVISDLLECKAAGLSEISNELWKHCDKSILDMLLVFLNSCLICKLVPNGVLTNTRPIALIKTAHKVLSKILLNRILSVYSTFDVLHENNFLVLRSTIMQLPIFAIGSVVEDALEKSHELWLVLQDMQKTYDLIMTDFGLTDGYRVHNGLDQEKVFSPLLWHIFYDSFLCKVKRQADGCGYRLNFYFISECGHAESQAGLSFFFTTGAFHILNIASKFFDINDISINNDKTVAISINCKIADSSLLISGIYLSTEGFSKPSLAKAHSDVQFFANLVLKKAVSDKQFLYLVLVVLFSIIGYRTQFSYVLVSACKKWDTLICKGLKSKSGLPHDFSSDAIYHLSLYGLKTFKQIQAKNKLASYLVRVKINSLNNFLAGMVCIFFRSDLSLGGSLTDAFCHQGRTPMSCVLGKSTYFKYVSSLWCYRIVFVKQLLDQNGAIFDWKTFKHIVSSPFVYSLPLDDSSSSNILCFCGFSAISANLLCSDVGRLSVYMNEFLSSLGSVDMKARATVFFENIGMSLGVGVSGLMSSILTELQTIALALECVPSSHSINLFSDSQVALDACKLELDLVCPDFRNWCWIECYHIINVICHKNLDINWCKVKGHLGVLDNKHVDELARAVALSSWTLSYSINKQYLKVGGTAISGNLGILFGMFFVSSGSWVVVDSLHSHMAAGFWMYFIKALHLRLSVAMCKQLYDKSYPSVVCLFCGDVKVLDHVFSCLFDVNNCARLLNSHALAWRMQSGLGHFFSVVSQLLCTCSSNILVSTALCKSFVFKDWFHESISVFKDSKVASQNIVAFVREFSYAFWEDIWLVHAKHHAFMEKNGLILCDGSVSISISGLFSVLSVGVIELLGVAEAIGVGFGFHKFCSFFSGIGDEISVHISI